MSADGEFVLPVGTVTLLLADIEGSARLWDARPDEMTAGLAHHDEVVVETIGRHGGVRPVEQGEGDSFVAAFARPSEAVACALDLQRSIHEPLRLRIGLHTGEVQLRDEANYIGATVTRCARLRDTAHGGQTVLSQACADLIVDRLQHGVTLRDLGSHRLRDLARPERVFQLCHPDLQDDFPALRSLDAHPHNLPVARTTFVGRERAMREVRGLLEASRLVTLTGGGGCGKTRLAMQVAADVLDGYPDGAWWVDLAPAADGELVASAAAQALSVRPEQGRALTETIARQIGGKRMVIVLDNCEHLIGASAALADALLQACPSLSVLATSREPLGVDGETTWRVPSMSVPDEKLPPRIDALGSFEAVRLFVDRAVRVRPNFVVTNETAPAVAAICQRLEGIPLAIELAAARSRVLTTQQILDGLADRFRLLVGASRTAAPRQQTLQASVDWSHDLLTEPERVVFRRLSVFAGGFTLDAAEDVCSLEPIGRFDVLDLLTSLVDRSLVAVDDAGTNARYTLLETIRQYAADRLRNSDEEGAMRDRHRAHYLTLAETAEPNLLGRDGFAWRDRLDADHDNLRSAIRWSLDQKHDDAALRLVTALTMFWYLRDAFVEAGRWFDELMPRISAVPDPLRARALWGAGWTVWLSTAEVGRASALAQEAADVARQAGDARTTARAVTMLGFFLAVQSPAAARPVLDEGTTLSREVADGWSLCMALLHGGVTTFFLEGMKAARPPMAEALELARSMGIHDVVAESHLELGWFEVMFRGLDLAERSAGDLALVARERRSGFYDGLATILLSAVAAGRGDYEQARRLADDASAVLAQVSPVIAELYGVWAGVVALWSGDAEYARQITEKAVPGFRGLALGPYFQCWHAETYLALGDTASARVNMQEALAAAEERGCRWMAARARYGLGLVARAEGDLGSATSLLHEALPVQVTCNHETDVADTLDAFAGVAACEGYGEHAVRLIAATQAFHDARRAVRPRFDHARVDADLALAREGLSDDEYEAAWTSGTAMTLDDAVAYTTRGRGERKRPSTGWASLTAVEAEVVGLVAQGLTNPQIGERLFISPRTVQSHLRRIFSRVGVTTRAELASEATRRSV